MYPLKMKPVFNDYLWGGTRLKELYGKDVDFAAESWEASCHPNGLSVIANGELAGHTLASVVGEFPLLFKLIDAKDKLSVQVHPDDSYANLHENGGLGKTELWYVLEAEPGSRIIYGVKPGVTKEEFGAAIEDGTLEDLLNYADVKKGDCFFIPAGLVHAIGDGLIVAEIQQNSDTTYRVYDYNRVGADGKLRELHVEKALDVIDFNAECRMQNAEIHVKCEYFTFEKVDVTEGYEVSSEALEILFFAEGEGVITGGGVTTDFRKGDTFVIPKEMREYEIRGKCCVLRSCAV